MIEFQYRIESETGIHARQIGQMVRRAREFKCQIEVENRGRKTDLKELLPSMRIAARRGDTLTFCCDGEDEALAADAIRDFLEDAGIREGVS